MSIGRLLGWIFTTLLVLVPFNWFRLWASGDIPKGTTLDEMLIGTLVCWSLAGGLTLLLRRSSNRKAGAPRQVTSNVLPSTPANHVQKAFESDDGIGYIRLVGDNLSCSAKTSDEMKLALKELKLKKKEWVLLKRTLTDKQRDIRAGYTQNNRSRGPMLTGGGGTGKFIRAVQRTSRSSARNRLADDLAPLAKQKQAAEATIRAFDKLVLQIEQKIFSNGAQPGVYGSPPASPE